MSVRKTTTKAAKITAAADVMTTPAKTEERNYGSICKE